MVEGEYLLDSNICIYLLKNLSQPLTERVADQSIGSLCISTITLAEISVGYGKDVFDAPDLAGFLEMITLVPFDEQAAKTYGTMPFRRARFDRLIAAHAVSLGLIIVTNNEADFANVPGLQVENWTI